MGGGVCALRFGDATEFLHEPVVAIDARHPDVMAVAAIAARTDRQLDPLLAGEGHVQQQDRALFVTRDAGATWARAALPPPPAPSPPIEGTLPDVELWDPQLGFDASGALHVVGVLLWQGVDGSAKQQLITHLATPDLGATWTSYQELGVNRADHAWMTIEADGTTIDVAWMQLAHTTLGFARSVDAGQHWTPLDPNVPEIPCQLPSQVVQGPYGLVVVCPRDERFAKGPDSPPKAAYQFDAATNRFVRVGAVPPMSMPNLFALPDGSLLLVSGEFYTADILVARSTDGGATWTSFPDLGARLASAQGWSFLQFMSGSVDPWGHVQLMVRGEALPPQATNAHALTQLPAFLAGTYSDDFQVAHVVLDPLTGEVLGERIVTPDLVPHAPSASPGAGYARGADYFAIAYAPGRAVLVWEYQRSVYLGTWTP